MVTGCNDNLIRIFDSNFNKLEEQYGEATGNKAA